MFVFGGYLFSYFPTFFFFSVNGCSSVSSSFHAFVRKDELIFFYFAILQAKTSLIISLLKVKKYFFYQLHYLVTFSEYIYMYIYIVVYILKEIFFKWQYIKHSMYFSHNISLKTLYILVSMF